MFKVTADLVKKCQKYKEGLDLTIKNDNANTAFVNASKEYEEVKNNEAFSNLIKERNNKLKKLHALDSNGYDRKSKKIYEDYQSKLENIIFKFIKAYYEVEQYNIKEPNSANNLTKFIVEDLGQVLGVNRKQDTIEQLFRCIDGIENPVIEKEYFEDDIKFEKGDINLDVNVDEYINEKDTKVQIKVDIDAAPKKDKISEKNNEQQLENEKNKTSNYDENIKTYIEGFLRAEILNTEEKGKRNSKEFFDYITEDYQRKIAKTKTREDKSALQLEKNKVEIGIWLNAKKEHEQTKWGIHFIKRIQSSIRLNKIKKSTGLSDETLNNIYSSFKEKNFLENDENFKEAKEKGIASIKKAKEEQGKIEQAFHPLIDINDLNKKEHEIDLSAMNIKEAKWLDDMVDKIEAVKSIKLQDPEEQKDMENYSKLRPEIGKYKKDPKYTNKETNQNDQDAIEDENGLIKLQ